MRSISIRCAIVRGLVHLQPWKLILNFFECILCIIAYADIGDPDTVCLECGAMVWYGERAEKYLSTPFPKISMCCMKGKITIPNMLEPPPLIQNLFMGLDPRSSHFLSNVRSYNNMFAFTSLGGKIEFGGNDGCGPPQFVISGQNYHRIGSLVPDDGSRPKFAQLYINDTQNDSGSTYV
jgi:hypothetical protein